jgi:signal transduction histidine kinase
VSGVCVSITDTGSGIGADQAQHVFEPFFTTKSTKGPGLGLWISKGIVQKYGGTIRFRSLLRSSGNVTCFRVFFPEPHRPASATSLYLADDHNDYAELAGSSNVHE